MRTFSLLIVVLVAVLIHVHSVDAILPLLAAGAAAGGRIAVMHIVRHSSRKAAQQAATHAGRGEYVTHRGLFLPQVEVSANVWAKRSKLRTKRTLRLILCI